MNTPVITDTHDIALPGRLESQAWVELHTRAAVNLFHGYRKKFYPIGIKRFVGLLTPIYFATGHDNPYADWFLLQQERYLDKNLQQLEERIATYRQILHTCSGIEFTLSASKKPIKLSLDFTIPGYGASATRLIKAYDDLVRVMQSALHQGVTFDTSYQLIMKQSRDEIRRTLHWVLRWPKDLQVTRADIRVNNEQAKQAHTKIKHLVGTLDHSIATGSQRPKYGIQNPNRVLPTSHNTVPNSTV